MKKFYFVLMTLALLALGSLVSAQNIWSRTFSGSKDAIVHSFVDESSGDVYVVGSNGYNNIPVTSAEEPGLSSHFLNTTTGIGQFVAKFDKYGNTVWYRKLGNAIGIPKGKVMLSEINSQLVVMFNNGMYTINPSTGNIIDDFFTSYPLFDDFDLIRNGSNEYILAFHYEQQGGGFFTWTGIYDFNFNELEGVSFGGFNLQLNYVNDIAFKIHTIDEKDFLLGLNLKKVTPTSSATLYIQDSNNLYDNIPFNSSQGYYLMKFNVGNSLQVNYERSINSVNGIYDFDVFSISGSNNDIIYTPTVTSRLI